MSNPTEILEEIRAELERMYADGELVVYEVADDRGLDIDEYVELFRRVLTTINTHPKP